MFKKLTLLFAACILLVSTHSYAAQGQQFNLKWNFTKGQTFTLEGTLQFDGSAEIPFEMLLAPAPAGQQPAIANKGSAEKATGNLNLNILWKVTVMSVDSQGNADLQLELRSADIKAFGSIGEQQINYEADLLEPVMTPEGIHSVINPQDAVNIWKVAPNGKIIAINGENIDNTLSQIQQELTNSGISVNQTEMRQFTDMFLYFMAIYPNKPVSIGETWTRKVDLSNLFQKGSNHDGVIVNNFKLLLQQNWKVKNSNGGQLTLEEKSNAMPEFRMTLDGPEATINFTATGNEQSTVKVDQKNGRVSSSEQQLNITGKLNALEKNGSTQEFQIPFKLNMKSNFSLSQ